MKPLTDRISEARDIAAEREGDIRLQEFLRAMVIETEPGNGEFWWVTIRWHGKSWHLFPQPNNIETLEALNTEDLSHTVTEWVQGAIDGKFLTLSNPPVVHRKYQP